MVESVEKVDANLNFPAFAKSEILENRKVQVLNCGGQECVAPGIRQCAVAGLNVSGIGIRRQVTHGPLRICQSATANLNYRMRKLGIRRPQPKQS